MSAALVVLLLSGCARGVCDQTVALTPGGRVDVCGGGWVHLGWTPDVPDADAPRLDLVTTTDLLTTAELPAGGVWGNRPALVGWVPGADAAVLAEGGESGVVLVSPAEEVVDEAGLVAVPTRGRASVVVQREADLGPVEVWARSEVSLRDPEGAEVGFGREVVWWGPGTGAWEVVVDTDWDVVYTRTWGADFGEARDEVEPNDDADAADALEVQAGAPVVWDGVVDGDEDWFALDATGSGTATLSCADREVGGLVRPTYQVFDPSGRLSRDLNARAYAVGAAEPWNHGSFPLVEGRFLVRIFTEEASPNAYYRCELDVG